MHLWCGRGVFSISGQVFEQMNRAFETARLHPVIDREFPCEKAQEAFS
jgi:hypothetical protein